MRKCGKKVKQYVPAGWNGCRMVGCVIKYFSKKGKVLGEKSAVRAGLSGHKAGEARLRWFGHVQKIGTVNIQDAEVGSGWQEVWRKGK